MIQIDFDIVNNYNNQINDYIGDLNSYMTKFSTTLDSVNTVWQGADALKYLNVMQDVVLNELKEMISVLTNYVLYINKVLKAYKMLDSAYASKKIEIGDLK